MTSPPAVSGTQTPRASSIPPAADTFGDDAVKLAARAGLNLYPWQQHTLRSALGVVSGGRWAAFESCLVVPRQNGKGAVLEALELFHLFLPEPGAPPPLVLHSAHEFRTSAEHFRRMRHLIENSPMLMAQVRAVRTTTGSESIELKTGARIKFTTRTSGSGRGFSADLVVLDEAYKLSKEQMAAILPTLSARPNPQVWYTSSAPMPHSETLAAVRARGLAGGDPSLCFLEWSAAPGSSLDDRAAWAQANPSLGFRPGVDPGIVAAERAALPDEEFGRERLGLVPDTQDSTPSAIDERVWKAAADPSASRGTDPVFGVATAPDRSWSAIGVGWHRPDGRCQVMLVEYRPHTAWLEARVAELRSRWAPRAVLLDTASKGIVVGATPVSEVDQTAAENGLADLLEGDGLRHGNEPALGTAVRGARWRMAGNSRRLEQKGAVDISPLRAVALAAHALRTATGPSGYEDRGFVTL